MTFIAKIDASAHNVYSSRIRFRILTCFHQTFSVLLYGVQYFFIFSWSVAAIFNSRRHIHILNVASFIRLMSQFIRNAEIQISRKFQEHFECTIFIWKYHVLWLSNYVNDSTSRHDTAIDNRHTSGAPPDTLQTCSEPRALRVSYKAPSQSTHKHGVHVDSIHVERHCFLQVAELSCGWSHPAKININKACAALIHTHTRTRHTHVCQSEDWGLVQSVHPS